MKDINLYSGLITYSLCGLGGLLGGGVLSPAYYGLHFLLLFKEFYLVL
jgi:hypothetical protein